MSEFNSSGDSSDLEALFDSIAGGVVLTTPAPAAAAPVKPSLMRQAREGDGSSDDSVDLQALFDSIADKKPVVGLGADRAGETTNDGAEEWPVQEKVFNKVGLMARQLHDTLGALGYDKLIEKTVSALPDAKDRLAYIANLTEQAACRVLNATDIAVPLQDELEAGANLLSAKWETLFANQMSVEDFKLLAAETRVFVKKAVPMRTTATKEQLMEIMMAQDFQDLTGQVIKKVVALAQDLETQLMSVLIETMPGEKKRTASVSTLLNGPVINAEGRADVVASQQQVDDLLDSLGF